jgi:uncharacterized membrane protein
VKKPQPTGNKPDSVQVTTSAHWQGPLPPPDALQKFDAIVENGAERVFRMAEVEQQHRIESERAALQSNIDAAQSEILASRRGLQLGAAISILSILAALATVFMGANWAVSVALVGVPLMSAVRALILRK